MSNIQIGEPLQWDVTDASGHLLLRKGYIVERASQVEALVARGLFVEATANAPIYGPANAAPPQEAPSVLRSINLANKRLDRLLFGLHNETDFPNKILEIAKIVTAAVDLNPDIAVACILLNQQAVPYPIRHCVDTAVVSILIARSMEIAREEILTITAAALTMNVGMIKHHAQLERKQYALSAELLGLIRQHPEDSVKMLESAGVRDPNWLAYVLAHHEVEDGTGYPFGKAGNDIPRPAKIIALADRYCACVSARDFRKSTLPNIALRDIFLDKGKGIDHLLTTYFIKELGIYPPGTFVRLNNGEIGVVSKKGEGAATPIVHALVGANGVPLALPIKRNTATETLAIKETLHESQANIHFSMQQIWGDEASF
ncbi:MAG TPA: HD domain-containing phosphohydrolase [Sulfuricella sp.]|nr:HD domain-containing phosphohydrolase [Sulfuricella sp.]